MTREEQNKVFALLSQYFPRARQLKSRDTLAAWRLVLEKFTYPDVKAAVVDYAARNKFFPDVADITGQLAQQNTPSPLELESIRKLKEKQP